MYGKFRDFLNRELISIEEAGFYKRERVIASHQGPVVKLESGEDVLIMCANNYLGLSSHPKVVEAAKRILDERGYGMSSVRFICGTQDIHLKLEEQISTFLGTDDTILYAACFDANGGVFEPLLGPEDAIISDELNHASIIDGIRLCKAVRHRFKHSDMDDLEEKLKLSAHLRHRMIVTDGVFSMDGDIAKLDRICALAEKYEALVMADDSHATGFIGKSGRGTHEHCGVTDMIDLITGTLGKALGGAMGGFASGRKEIISMLRQHSRPYLFSNSLAPPVVGAALEVFELLASTTSLRDKLEENARYFRRRIREVGFETKEGSTPIIPVMLYDAKLARRFADELLKKGIYTTGFFYPVVPKDQARIRVQVSAAHEKHHLDKAIEAFAAVGKELKVIGRGI